MEAKLDNRVLVLTRGKEVHLVIKPYKGMTNGELDTLQAIVDNEFNQELVVTEVEESQDYYHFERILRRANGVGS